MTIEEALKIIKEFINGTCLHLVDQEALETLIPELAESEDEKIRKGLIEALKTSKTVGELKFILPEPTREECIAYLEKLKGKMTAEEFESSELFQLKLKTKYANGYQDGLAQKEQKEIPLMNGDADLYFDNWIQYNDTTKRGCFEEGIRYAQRLQKEQKPLSTEETELNSIAFLEQMGYLCIPPGKELKPAEWGEKEKENLDKCCAVIAQPDTFFDTYFRQKCLDFLFEISKKFSLPPKQEWSEEDENNLNKLLQWDGIPLGLRSWVSGLPEKVGTRPSWKPSEEQIAALNYAYCRLFKSEYVGHNILGPLQKLCDELAKL